MKILVLSAVIILSWPSLSYGQDSLLMRDFEYVTHSDLWLGGNNAAALTRYSSDNISQGETYLSRSHGGFTDFNDSRDVVEAGALVESFYRINKRTVVAGKMSYCSYDGKEMGGSAFINTSHLPFDIEEDSLTNLGKKHRDTYHLMGGVGVDLWHGLSVGGHIDYTAANYAKYKDLRHKNKLMDLSFSTGVYVPFGSAVRLGASYYYRRTTESVLFSTYSHQEKVYKSLINFGPYIGRVEQFGMYGFTDSSREMPLVDDYNGFSAELGVDAGRFSVFNDFLFAHRKGYYGRKSPYTVTYTHHYSNVYHYHGGISYNGTNSLHTIETDISVENLENHLSNFRETTNESGANYYEYFDLLKTANKVWVDGNIEYTAHWNIHGDLPLWSATAGLSWMHREQTGYAYPYYRHQHIDNRCYSLSITRRQPLKRGVLSITATASFLHGKGKPFDDGTFTEPSDKQVPPPTMDTWLYRELQFLTSPQYNLCGETKYTFIIPKTNFCTYISAKANHRKANATNIHSLGSDRGTINIAIGCIF